jgi:predicted nucleotide-binding protein
MRLPPQNNTVYLAGERDPAKQDATLFMAGLLAEEHGLTVIGDHRDSPRERGSYRDRVDEMLSGCVGMVMIFPKEDFPETTNNRMFVELLLAAKHHLPLLIFCEDGVEFKCTFGSKQTKLTFGGSRDTDGAVVTLEQVKKESFEVSMLNGVHSVVFRTPPFIERPIVVSPNLHQIQAQAPTINAKVRSFTENFWKPEVEQYVFNISPYSKVKERMVVADIVYRVTGLSCINASDAWAGAPFDREEIKDKICNAFFVIADLSGGRNECVFEVGVAVGSGCKTLVVRKKTDLKLPFGLRRFTPLEYLNEKDLESQLLRLCYPFRRRVFNVEVGDSTRSFEKKDGEITMTDAKPRIFVGSSVEGLNVARAIQKELNYDYHIELWNQSSVFRLGTATLEALEAALDAYDYAIFVFTPDDLMIKRDSQAHVVRDNVIFEAGLFIGRKGRFNAFVVHPSDISIQLPSDFHGITAAKYEAEAPNLVASVGAACSEIRAAIAQSG